MIDWHCHILPGIDDGPATMDEAVEMAGILREVGYSDVYCTPHLIRGAFDASRDRVGKGVAELQERLNTLRIDLRLFPGREYYLDEFLAGYLADPQPLGTSGQILIETAGHMSPDYLKETCYRIRSGGFIPLIAHPERSPRFELPPPSKNGLREWFHGQCSRLQDKRRISNVERSSNPLVDYLSEIGCKFQGNIGSFAGIYGEPVRRQAVAFLEAGLYDRLGTDAHSARHLKQWLAQGLREAERIAGAEAVRRLLGAQPGTPGSDTMKRDDL